jgi:GTP-binding protein
MTTRIHYEQATFLQSAAALQQLPADQGIEVAFAGRSNAGKSSALNAITHVKGLAKSSKTPGRTQLINLFRLDENRRLVDLPGYGYAKVPEAVKSRWQHALSEYLQERNCLQGLMLLMDIRHPLKELDAHLIDWAIAGQLPIHVLLTKADKLTHGQATQCLQNTRRALDKYENNVTVQLFSIHQPTTVLHARQQLNTWFNP